MLYLMTALNGGPFY